MLKHEADRGTVEGPRNVVSTSQQPTDEIARTHILRFDALLL